MAKITVKFYSLWSSYLGKNTIILEVSNIDEALHKLDTMFATQLREKLHQNKVHFENFKESSTVLVNGISLRNFKNNALSDGDTLHIFPPIAGG